MPNPFYCDNKRAGSGGGAGAGGGVFTDHEVQGHAHRESGRNLAIVAEEHVRHWVPGRRFVPDEEVYILPSPAYDAGDAVLSSPSTHTDTGAAADDVEHVQGAASVPTPPLPTGRSQSTAAHPDKPLLWQGGRRGGHARIRAWKRCGKQSGQRGWFSGQHILRSVPWVVEDEDASILLLQEDGSTGLDLSFATHIFLLDQLRDPALENQIISRAHRMGAMGPVNVVLLLANELGWKGDGKDGSGSNNSISSSSSSSAAAKAKDARRRSAEYVRGTGA